MTVTAEFFGVTRSRTSTAAIELEAGTVGDLLRQLGECFPELARTCLAGDRPAAGYLVNVNGERFTADPATPLSDGDCVLLLSADVGG